MLIYSDSIAIDRAWVPLLQFNEPIEICHSIEEYVAHPSKNKIAFTTERMGSDYDKGDRKSVPGDSCGWHLEGFEDKINKLSAVSQLVFSAEGEMHTYQLLPLWEKCKNSNVHWVMPGAANLPEMKDNVIFWGDWFDITTRIYKEVPDELDKLTFQYPKEKSFDALLGRVKPHRTFVYDAVHNANLSDKFFMTYYLDCLDVKRFFKEKFIWDSGCELIPGSDMSGTHSEVNFRGMITGVSRIIPTDIYNKSAYSIIAETNGDNAITFFTEKTAKPMISKRLFVAFSGYRFLECLQSLGFRTFSNVIDESYDQIENDEQRFRAAFDQVKRLCDMDQLEVAEKIKNTVEHNYNLIMSTNWRHRMIHSVQEKINSL